MGIKKIGPFDSQSTGVPKLEFIALIDLNCIHLYIVYFQSRLLWFVSIGGRWDGGRVV